MAKKKEDEKKSLIDKLINDKNTPEFLKINLRAIKKAQSKTK